MELEKFQKSRKWRLESSLIYCSYLWEIIIYDAFPIHLVCEGDNVSSSTSTVQSNMVMMGQGQQQQQQSSSNMSMAATQTNVNIMSNDQGMQQQNASYQQMTYATTTNVQSSGGGNNNNNNPMVMSYGSPIVANVHHPQQQNQAMMQPVYQQQQQQILTERVGEMVRNNSSDGIAKLMDQGVGSVSMEQQQQSNVPMMYVPDSRGVSVSGSAGGMTVGAEQYQMVTTTTSVSGTMVMAQGVGMAGGDQQQLQQQNVGQLQQLGQQDNSGQPRQVSVVASGGMPNSEAS